VPYLLRRVSENAAMLGPNARAELEAIGRELRRRVTPGARARGSASA